MVGARARPPLGRAGRGVVVDAAHFGWTPDFARWEGELGAGITVGSLRAKLGDWGMTPAMENAVLLTWAALGNWEFVGVGQPSLQSLPDGAAVRKANLPDIDDWEVARTRAGRIFGVAPETNLTPRAVARFGSAIKAALETSAVADLVAQLDEHGDVLGIEASAEVGRAATARRLNDLVASTRQAGNDKSRIESLATFDLPDELSAFGRTYATAERLARELHTLDWPIIAAAQTRADTSFDAAIAELRSAAAVDESVVPLEPRLRDVAMRARALVVQPMLGSTAPSVVTPTSVEPVPIDTDPGVSTASETSGTRHAPLTDLDKVLAELRAEIGDKAGPGAEVTITWRID